MGAITHEIVLNFVNSREGSILNVSDKFLLKSINSTIIHVTSSAKYIVGDCGLKWAGSIVTKQPPGKRCYLSIFLEVASVDKSKNGSVPTQATSGNIGPFLPSASTRALAKHRVRDATSKSVLLTSPALETSESASDTCVPQKVAKTGHSQYPLMHTALNVMNGHHGSAPSSYVLPLFLSETGIPENPEVD